MDDTIPQDTPQKQCSKCKQFFPATTEFFNKHSRGGLQPRCKPCRKEDRKIYNDAHVEENRQYQQEHQEAARIRSRRFSERHQEEEYIRKKRYSETHREQERMRGRRHYEENREQERIRKRRYVEKNREKEQARQRRYYKTHLEKERARGRVNAQKRHAHQKNLEGQLSVQQIQSKLKAQKYQCYYCFHKFEQGPDRMYIYHLDHVIPISRPEFAPRHDASYIVLACPHCNLSKHDRLPHEWPRGSRLL